MLGKTRPLRRGSMPPKPGYKQPGRHGRVGFLLWLDRDLRTELKIAAIRNDKTVQAVLEEAARAYVESAKGKQDRPE